MVEKIDTSKFKKYLLLSYIKSKGNCKKFDEFTKLIATTESECHNFIIDLMKSELIIYRNDGYEINEELMKDYQYFTFCNDYDNFFYENMLKNINNDAKMYLPKSFINKLKK